LEALRGEGEEAGVADAVARAYRYLLGIVATTVKYGK
jgi:hypothetical protein